MSKDILSPSRMAANHKIHPAMINFSVETTKLSSTIGVTLYKVTYCNTTRDAAQPQSTENGSDNVQLSIWKRYKEFRELRKSVLGLHPNLELPNLEQGTYLDRFKPEVIEERRQKLETFLAVISQTDHLSRSDAFLKFLHPRNNSLITNTQAGLLDLNLELIEKFSPTNKNSFFNKFRTSSLNDKLSAAIATINTSSKQDAITQNNVKVKHGSANSNNIETTVSSEFEGEREFSGSSTSRDDSIPIPIIKKGPIPSKLVSSYLFIDESGMECSIENIQHISVMCEQPQSDNSSDSGSDVYPGELELDSIAAAISSSESTPITGVSEDLFEDVTVTNHIGEPEYISPVEDLFEDVTATDHIGESEYISPVEDLFEDVTATDHIGEPEYISPVEDENITTSVYSSPHLNIEINDTMQSPKKSPRTSTKSYNLEMEELSPSIKDDDVIENDATNDLIKSPIITDDEPDWFVSAMTQTDSILERLESISEETSKLPRPSSVYDTPSLQSLIADNVKAPPVNPVNISSSEDTSNLTGIEAVSLGQGSISKGLKDCEAMKLEEGLNLLEEGIEFLLIASRDLSLDKQYRKQLRGSIKQYLSYAEQVKSQLNEQNLQDEIQRSNNSDDNNNKHSNKIDSIDIKLPTTLEGFKIISLIKYRHMLVYTANNKHNEDTPNKQKFLIKSLQKCRINYIDTRHRHIRLSQNLLPTFIHSSVAQMYGSFQTSHHIYLVLEYIPHHYDIMQVIEQNRNGTFLNQNASYFIKWSAQLISILEELHILGMFYLTLCPWNILITGNEHSVKLTYPTKWEDTEDPIQDRANANYIAPECSDSSSPSVISESADWFSLGSILYELATGKPVRLVHMEGIQNKSSIYFDPQCFENSSLDRGQVTEIISQLLTYNHTERLKYAKSIQSHSLFSSTNWPLFRTHTSSLLTFEQSHF